MNQLFACRRGSYDTEAEAWFALGAFFASKDYKDVMEKVGWPAAVPAAPVAATLHACCRVKNWLADSHTACGSVNCNHALKLSTEVCCTAHPVQDP